MRLYLDTSALIKGYIAEAGSPEVVAAATAASSVGTSMVAYVEARAAFARARREGRIDAAAHTAHVGLLDAHWPLYAVIAADQPCLREAGRLTDKYTGHAVRAFDAIHLASALVLAAGRPSSVTFGCWDQRLWRAARDEGFTMLPPNEPV